MRKQMTETRPSVVELDRARRSIQAKRRTGLDKLRLAARKPGETTGGTTMTEIFDRAVRGFEKQV
ncbi:hypothetical protein [Nisaea sediminum]|uniref:hypothetical protein n=1 Tax=Nisaea sediminum TaxID=2775867 RepID=UPI001866B1EF|nr:hypothetical protein [Nisaea sediminum]